MTWLSLRIAALCISSSTALNILWINSSDRMLLGPSVTTDLPKRASDILVQQFFLITPWSFPLGTSPNLSRVSTPLKWRPVESSFPKHSLRIVCDHLRKQIVKECQCHLPDPLRAFFPESRNKTEIYISLATKVSSPLDEEVLRPLMYFFLKTNSGLVESDAYKFGGLL